MNWRDSKHGSSVTIGSATLEVWASRDRKAWTAFVDSPSVQVRAAVAGATLADAKLAALEFARRALEPWGVAVPR
jgi:hypothetical protein